MRKPDGPGEQPRDADRIVATTVAAERPAGSLAAPPCAAATASSGPNSASTDSVVANPGTAGGNNCCAASHTESVWGATGDPCRVRAAALSRPCRTCRSARRCVFVGRGWAAGGPVDTRGPGAGRRSGSPRAATGEGGRWGAGGCVRGLCARAPVGKAGAQPGGGGARHTPTFLSRRAAEKLPSRRAAARAACGSGAGPGPRPRVRAGTWRSRDGKVDSQSHAVASPGAR